MKNYGKGTVSARNLGQIGGKRDRATEACSLHAAGSDGEADSQDGLKCEHLPTKRILIANRGEIAIRVAKAVRELGHTAIGLWTDNEPEAAHLSFCDEWVHLPGTTHAETYLNIEALCQLAQKEKADGVHPGYGFLSENANFARALEKCGIVFIGPNPKAIEQMGDKATSKALAISAGVPVIPGAAEAIPDIRTALKAASEIGYPVLLKAVAGGGGRGMRTCFSPADIEQQFEAVGREALAAFGNSELLVEKFIEGPHHIEVQILADKKGHTYHLFERECSIQRRHQKIVEEAPSPFIGNDEELRRDICTTAVKLAQAVKYDSAGTVEFIMDAGRKFYFLEMNTRIQVEHPITEEMTGIDLIVAMIKIAFEEDFGITAQEQIARLGHAIECRICAEDPATMRPAPGLVTGLKTHFPQGIRFDHCLYLGLRVTPDFDPMVGKLVAKAYHRQQAIDKMKCALNGLDIQGLKSNIPLHLLIFGEENFVRGDYSTAYLEEMKLEKKLPTGIDTCALYRQLALVEWHKMEMQK